MPTIKARKAEVEADSIVRNKRGKHHQTNTHNAQTHVANKDVEVRVLKQYPNSSGNPERPLAGSTVKGTSATISSRKTAYLGPADKPKRTKGIFEDDVTINIKKRKSPPSRKSSGSKSQNTAYARRKSR